MKLTPKMKKMANLLLSFEIEQRADIYERVARILLVQYQNELKRNK